MAGRDYHVCVAGQRYCRLEINQKGLFSSDQQCKNKNSFKCKLWCCKTCSFFRRVVTKESLKSQLSYCNKYCERHFLCKSVEFCRSCHKCPNCCPKSTCRGQISPVWGKMGSLRCQPQSGNSPQGMLHPTLPVPAKFDQVTKCHKLLSKSPQEPLPVGGIASAYVQKCNRTSNKSNISGLLQPVILGSQTQQPVETYTGSEQLKQISKDRVVQNGDPRDNKNLPTSRGAGDLNRFQRRILPLSHPESVHNVHAFSHPGKVIPIQSTTIRPLHSSHGVYCSGQRGQISCTTKGYKDPPVPR